MRGRNGIRGSDGGGGEDIARGPSDTDSNSDGGRLDAVMAVSEEEYIG